jgi:membrane protein
MLWRLARETVADFLEDDALTLGAALAFYTALSMSPLVVLLLWFASALGEGAQRQLVAQIQALVGPDAGEAIRGIVENADARPGLGNVAGVVSLVTLVASVSGVFSQLQYALNRIWNVKAAPGRSGLWPWIRKRLLSIGVFASVGFVLVVSLALTAFVAAASEYASGVLPGSDAVWQAVTFVLSLVVTAAVFAILFRFLPDATVGWRETWIGAVATAVLFAIGRSAIGLYLGQSSVGSAYGAAGSFMVLLVWVYYASLIVFMGAELTKVLARALGARVQPEGHAVRIETREREVERPASSER